MKLNFINVSVNEIVVDHPIRLDREINKDGVLAELKDNIKQYGIKVPLIISKHEDGTYRLVDGHRRLQVAKFLEFSTVPCVFTDKNTAMEVALSINLHREDLTSIEIGNILLQLYTQNKLIDEKYKYANLSPLVNKSKAYISQHIGYVEKLSDSIQKDIVDNKRHIDKNILARIYVLDEKDQLAVYNQMITENLGRESVQKLIDGLSAVIEEISDEETPIEEEVVLNQVNEARRSSNDFMVFTSQFVDMKIRIESIEETHRINFQQEMNDLLKKYNLLEEI